MLDNILIVGCGNMGGAMLAGWLAGGIDPARFTVVDPVLTDVPAGVALRRDLPEVHEGLVLLGVKPQLLGAVAPQLSALVGPRCVLISMLAGVELSSLAERFPQAGGLVRVDAGTQDAITALMQPLGEPLWLADDREFDLITALVGSGPAFVYRFIDALAAGAASLGLDPDQAERFAVSMVEGAAALAASADASPAELARRVSSPGGTTERGVAVLDAGGALASLVEATLRAARDRGRELAEAARSGD
jgi:pyrroline-5-carboxylate reductase